MYRIEILCCNIHTRGLPRLYVDLQKGKVGNKEGKNRKGNDLKLRIVEDSFSPSLSFSLSFSLFRKRSILQTCPLYRSQRCTNAIEISYIHIRLTCIYFIKYVTARIFLSLSLALHLCYCPVHTFTTNRILNWMLNA